MHTIKFNGIDVIFGIMPKLNLMRTSIFVISTLNLEHNLVIFYNHFIGKIFCKIYILY